MNLDRFNSWLTLSANLAVLAGILFLAYEIQQSNRIAIATTEIEIRAGYGVLNELIIAEGELAEIFVKAESADAKLSAAEELRLLIWMTQIVNQWMAIETAYQNEMIPASTYGVIFNDQRFLMKAYPALRPLLRQTIGNYPALSSTETFLSAERLLEEYSE
jgi:hypothetical protein